MLEDGTHLKGSATGLGSGHLAQFFGQPVVVEGSAEFQPSGRVQRIEAEMVELATLQDLSLWGRAPRPSFRQLSEPVLSQAQGPRSGINAIVGKWPGTESYEEFLQTVAEIS